MNTPYFVPENENSNEILINKSRFIATIRRVQSLADMRQFHHELKSLHPKASHNCWAVIAGAPEDSSNYGFSDDGEPNGTAGKPMFKVLHYSGKGQIGVIVTRYFGGIKLGTGGLVRAYTQATQTLLEKADFFQFSLTKELHCTFPYEDEGLFRYILEQHGVTEVNYAYAEKVLATLKIREEDVDLLTKKLQDKFGYSLRCDLPS